MRIEQASKSPKKNNIYKKSHSKKSKNSSKIR